MMKENFEKKSKENSTDNLIDDLLDMPDMEDDEKFRQWLEKQYVREGEEIEKALLAGREYEDNLDKADEMRVSRDRFYERLKEEGLLEEETEKDPENEPAKEAAEESSEESTPSKVISMEEAASAKKNPSGKSRKIGYHRLGKIAGVAGVCLLCVFAASMSSEANRNYFVDKIRYWSGDDTRVVVDNDETNEPVSSKEYEAIQDIEEKLSVKIPEFYYRPYGMEFVDYTVNEDATVAYLEYQFKENVITLFVDKQNKNTASNTNSRIGVEKETEVVSREGEKIIIFKIQDDRDDSAGYIAKWEENNVTYSVSGKIEKEELIKILKDMRF